MLVSKNVGELCALLIDEIFGELPSRIFASLLNRGRSSLSQLAQDTSLTLRQLRHGLAVLIQHNLLYYNFDAATKTTSYEANPEPAYNLIRTGRILEMVESLFASDGPDAKDVMQNILLVGQTRISDLRDAYREKLLRQGRTTKQIDHEIDEADDELNNATSQSVVPVESLSRLNFILCRLAEAELIDVVNTRSFQNPGDIYHEIEREIISADFPAGVRGSKQKLELQHKISQRLNEIRAEPKSLKRKLEQNGHRATKKQKIFVNGDVSNGSHCGDADPLLDGNQVIRINYEKCLVELRNRRLVQFATEMIGETTSHVYAVLLRLLSRKISWCQPHPIMDSAEEESEPDFTESQAVTTKEILNHLNISVNLSLGIGKASGSKIDHHTVDKIYRYPPREKVVYLEADVDGEASSDEETDESSDVSSEASDAESQHSPSRANSHPNGIRESKVKFQDVGSSNENRIDQLKQHLLLLCESKQQFVRHCDSNEWTVDFKPLVRRLQEAELDVVVEHTSGRLGLRLARILRERGKLDEKFLPTIALMKRSEVQNKMLEMQMAGFVDIQEVPRDTNRTASRTMFLWFSDTERCLGQLLDNTYKTMLRCMQTLAVHREKEQEVLSFTKRSDVRGKEKETMETAYYNKYCQFLDLERKLLGHVMRLDDLVAILRDY